MDTSSESLSQYIGHRIGEFDQIQSERRELLSQLGSYVAEQTKCHSSAQLTFLCTHNSRRSHLSQIWAQVAAFHFQLESVHTYSGGTEATAMNPRAVASLRRSGLVVLRVDTSSNPRYKVRINDNCQLECFSKIYDQPPNPAERFCAIMTCSDADHRCPVIPGAELRLPIRYEDPKRFDGQLDQDARYDERSRQIAREMLFAMQIAQQLR